MNQRNLFLISLAIAATIFVWHISYKKAAHPVKQNPKVIIVGTNAEFPPFSFIKDDEIVGFDIDVAKEVVKRLNKEIKIKDMSFEALVPEIQLGTIHMIAAGMTPTPERSMRVAFTKAHFGGDPLVMVTLSENDSIKSIDDLKDKHVIVNEGYTADTYVSTLTVGEITRLSTALVSDGLLALKGGRGDVFVAAQSSLKPYFEKFGYQGFLVQKIENTEETDSLAVSKKFPELYTQVQEVLDQMEEDGSLDALKSKWNL